MARFTDDSVLDAALANTATSTRLSLTSAQPANYAGIPALSLGSYTLTPGLGGASFSAAANGDTSGRKTTVAAQSGNNATASGTGNHVTLEVTGSSLLKHVTVLSANVSTNSGSPFTTSAWDVEFLDVTP